jgi:hypothetical protein
LYLRGIARSVVLESYPDVTRFSWTVRRRFPTAAFTRQIATLYIVFSSWADGLRFVRAIALDVRPAYSRNSSGDVQICQGGDDDNYDVITHMRPYWIMVRLYTVQSCSPSAPTLVSPRAARGNPTCLRLACPQENKKKRNEKNHSCTLADTLPLSTVGMASRCVCCSPRLSTGVFWIWRLCLEFVEDTIARERAQGRGIFCSAGSSLSSSTHLINYDNCRSHIRYAACDLAHLIYHHLYLTKSLRVSVYSVLILCHQR